MQTQWRDGPSGPTGLDYAGVRAWVDELALHGDERREVWAGLRACELAVLDVWRQREQERQQQREQQQRPLAPAG
ncbi:MAG: Phage related hypothetical protein [Pseudomonadota bacterium]